MEGSRCDTQAFPATGETEVPGQGHRSRPEARETEIPHGGDRASSDADETRVLGGGAGGAVSGASPSDADETAVLPAVGRSTAGSSGRPTGRTETWSAFDRRPSARRSDGVPAAGGGPSSASGRHAAQAARADAPSASPAAGADAAGASRNDAFPASGETRVAPAVRDPWAESDESSGTEAGAEAKAGVGAGATHDPHEVTIQLDGVGLQLDNMLRAAKGAPGGGGEGSDGPVFVDESGRRSRRFRRIGMAVALACAVYAVVIVATVLSGNSDAPWLPVEGPKEQPAGQVDTPPLPAESAPVPSGTGSVSPGASPTAGAGTTPSPGAGVAEPGASAGVESPGASADPKPSATKPTVNPDTDPTRDADPTVEPTVPDPGPDPTPTGGGPTEEPTVTPTVDEPGTGTVADGPSDPSPIAQEPDDTAAAPAATSPEYTL